MTFASDTVYNAILDYVGVADESHHKCKGIATTRLLVYAWAVQNTQELCLVADHHGNFPSAQWMVSYATEGTQDDALLLAEQVRGELCCRVTYALCDDCFGRVITFFTGNEQAKTLISIAARMEQRIILARDLEHDRVCAVLLPMDGELLHTLAVLNVVEYTVKPQSTRG